MEVEGLVEAEVYDQCCYHPPWHAGRLHNLYDLAYCHLLDR